MGTVFQPVVTRPIPAGAEITERGDERIARWRDSRGALRTAEVRVTPSGAKIVQRIEKYMARYKDGQGVTQTVPTGCRDERAARSVLADLEPRSELVKAGVLTAAQDAISDHKRSTIASHVTAYLDSLKAKGTTSKHVDTQRRLLGAVIAGCRFRTLADIRREPVERWLAGPENARRSARTRNTYLNAAKWFCNWAVDVERLVANPLARIKPADERADRRRTPRAFTEEELVRLLDAARRRPLVEALRITKGEFRGQSGARVKPPPRAKLEALGQERALMYKTLALTGLRLGELAALRVCDVDLGACCVFLDARHEKNRQGSTIPLRADLAADLARWIGSEPNCMRRLFRTTANAVKVLDRDLRFAGIAKHDERGRTACVHSFRVSFATHLNRGGVVPRVAQAAMRHSDIKLTMSVYTDPKLLDVAGALDVLPDLPLAPQARPHADAS